MCSTMISEFSSMRIINLLAILLATSNVTAGQTVKAIAVLSSSEDVEGTINFTQGPNQCTNVVVSISGLKSGSHGFHVHTFGDISENCEQTGPHFNPYNTDHGAPTDDNRHAGDLGNIEADHDGNAQFTICDWQIPLTGEFSIIGRSVVVHAKEDDLGKGETQLSKTTGNSGAKIACGVIGIQDT